MSIVWNLVRHIIVFSIKFLVEVEVIDISEFTVICESMGLFSRNHLIVNPLTGKSFCIYCYYHLVFLLYSVYSFPSY